jgi:hypothetical protein
MGQEQQTTTLVVTEEKGGGGDASLSRRTILALFVAAMVATVLLTARPAHASTTFAVNVASDQADVNAGDGVCDVLANTAGSQCTLRAAIQEANKLPGADRINFNFPGTTGVTTLLPGSSLPQITDRVTIDDYSQPGASPNTLAKGTNAVLRVQLDGTNAGALEAIRLGRVARAAWSRGS